MVALDESEFARWKAAAERAQGAAGAQASAGYAEWSCFLYEQAAQLAVKGLLHGVGAGGWGHDLAALVAAADAAVGPAWPRGIAVAAERLSRFYLPTRYPDAVPGGVPGDRFTIDDVATAAADARAVFDAVDSAWAGLLAEANQADAEDGS